MRSCAVLCACAGGCACCRYAARAISRLSHSRDEIAAEIAAAGAISPLVNLLGGDRGDEAQEEAAGALYALAGNAGNRLEITEAGGIGPIVQLLGKPHRILQYIGSAES